MHARPLTDLASVTTSQKNKNCSRSDGRPQLSRLGLSSVFQGPFHVFSWIITRLQKGHTINNNKKVLNKCLFAWDLNFQHLQLLVHAGYKRKGTWPL